MNKMYHLGGTETIIWKDVISTISAAIGKNKWKISDPIVPIKIVAGIIDRFS